MCTRSTFPRTSTLAGDEFTLADLSHLPYTDLLLKTEAGAGFLRRPHLKAWWERISMRPSWLKITGTKDARNAEEYKKQIKVRSWTGGVLCGLSALTVHEQDVEVDYS